MLLLVVGGGTCTTQLIYSDSNTHHDNEAPKLPLELTDSTSIIMASTTKGIAPGHAGNLSTDQELKLQELWALVLKVFGLDLGEELQNFRRPSSSGSDASAKKKSSSSSMLGSFMGGKSAPADTSSGSGESLSSALASLSVADGADDKHGQAKEFQKAIADMKPDEIRSAYWSMVKMNNPDGLLLRFLRARKWDVKKALVMFISTIHWRAAEAHIDDDIMANGEGHAKKQSESTDIQEKKSGSEFLFQIREGKNFFHGVDKEGRPICIINVRKHRASDQSAAVMERYTAYTIETARLMLVDPVETAVSNNIYTWQWQVQAF